MNTYDLLKQAISKKQQVIATYNGYHREMCPHALGKKNGKEQCLFYQFAGESSSNPIIPGSEENWRCMSVNGLSGVSLQEGEWHTASNHSQPQTCIDDVDVEIHS
ncbi:unnamed protein product [marine sediment metagenome]|uniref:Uncharacterized protein n=1 Tax=marine sediment metagenome TaxID=412755 RepID=X1RQQ0_9ZZZZ